MELKTYLRILRKYWFSIAAVTLIGVAVAAILSLLAKPTYTSSTALYLSMQSANSASDLSQGASYTNQQVKSFALVADSPVVLQPTIDTLHLPMTVGTLAGRTTVSVPTNTSVISISVVDTDPQRAAATATEIATNLIKTVDNMAPKDSKGVATVRASVIQPAAVPAVPTSPKVPSNLAIGLLVGLFLGIGQALLRHILDRRVRTTDDISQLTEVPVIGTVAFGTGTEDGTIITQSQPQSPRAEDYRRIRTNLQFLGQGERANVIAMSSAMAGEGKTSTILNLAFALAATGRKVLLVDGDLRKPRIAHRLGLEGAAGLTTLLIGRAHFDDVVQPVADHLDVLPSGQTPPNPSELLGSERMAELIGQLGSRYDQVLIDCAPIVPVTDTALLAPQVGGVVMVCASGQVERQQVTDAIGAIDATGGHVLGIVLNKLRKADAGYGAGSYYGYGYGDKHKVEESESV